MQKWAQVRGWGGRQQLEAQIEHVLLSGGGCTCKNEAMAWVLLQVPILVYIINLLYLHIYSNATEGVPLRCIEMNPRERASSLGVVVVGAKERSQPENEPLLLIFGVEG